MEQQHLFSNRELRKRLVPIIVEQLLNSLMGTADTVMVSNVGPEAISAVSLVDSINVLIIQAFSALAAGGTILCSHYMGTKDRKGANHCAGQVTMVITCIAASAGNFRGCGAGGHGGVSDVFFLYIAVFPFYRFV